MAEPIGYFALVLHSHIPYVLAHGKSPHGTDWLAESAAETYLPLLDVSMRLEQMGIEPRYTLNLTPILQEQLASEAFKAEFVEYLQQKVDASVEDQKEFGKRGVLWQAGLAYFWQCFYSQQLEQFKERLNFSILEGFRRLQDSGAIEVITSAATHGYLPLLGLDECVRAQIALGVQTYCNFFGCRPRGFWLPECAYRPAYEWKPPVAPGSIPPTFRQGIETFLAEQELDYFFVDSHLLRGGQPLGTYAARFPALLQLYKRFLQAYRAEQPERTPYQPYWLIGSGVTHRPVAVFARDPETTVQVWSGEHGYPGDAFYLEFHKKHYPSQLRYWRVSDHKSDLGAKQPYEPYQAFERIQAHAEHFLSLVKGVLHRHREATRQPGLLVSMYDTELFGHWWFEGPEWVFEVIRRLAADPEIEMVTCSEYLHRFPPKEQVILPEGSWGEGGYHWIWLNEWTAWVWEQIYPAEARLKELIRASLDQPALHPYLEQAARELLLLESSDWPFLITTWSARDYAELRVQYHLQRFNQIAQLVERLQSGESPTPEQVQAYEESCARDRVFEHLELRWWSIP